MPPFSPEWCRVPREGRLAELDERVLSGEALPAFARTKADRYGRRQTRRAARSAVVGEVVQALGGSLALVEPPPVTVD